MRHFEAPPSARPGYWSCGEGTWLACASVDWCEENYELSPYVAEATNAATNLLFLLLSAFALAWTPRPSSFLPVYAMLGVVGFGSLLFHSTLLWATQLADELPMLWGMALAIRGFSVLSRGRGQRKWEGALLWGGTAAATAAYVATGAFALFQAFFICLVAAAGALGLSALLSLRGSEHAGQMAALFCSGCGLFALAFACWIADNEACEGLRWARDMLPAPSRPLLEMHGWWHLLSGTGLYLVITFGVLAEEAAKRVRGEELGGVRLRWDPLPFAPWVELTEVVAYGGPASEHPVFEGKASDAKDVDVPTVFVSGVIGDGGGVRHRIIRHRVVASEGGRFSGDHQLRQHGPASSMVRSLSVYDLTAL